MFSNGSIGSAKLIVEPFHVHKLMFWESSASLTSPDVARIEIAFIIEGSGQIAPMVWHTRTSLLMQSWKMEGLMSPLCFLSLVQWESKVSFAGSRWLFASPSQHFWSICSLSSEVLRGTANRLYHALLDRVGIAKRFSGSLVRPVGRNGLEGMRFDMITENYWDNLRYLFSILQNGATWDAAATSAMLTRMVTVWLHRQ